MMKQTIYIYKNYKFKYNENASTPDSTLQTHKTDNTFTLHESTELQTHSKQIHSILYNFIY